MIFSPLKSVPNERYNFGGLPCLLSLINLDYPVGLQGRHDHIEEPKQDENARREILTACGSAQLTRQTNSAKGQNAKANHWGDQEESYWEREGPRGDHISATFSLLVVDAGDCPWKAQAEEHIDRVGAGDVANGRICKLRILGGRFRSKRVGKGGTKGHKSDGSYRLLDTQGTPQKIRKLSHNHHDKSNKDECNDKGEPASGVACRRYECKEYFPTDSQKVHCWFHQPRMLNIVVFVKLGTQVDGCLKLLAPRQFSLRQQILHKLLVCLVFCVLFILVVNNFNDANLFASQLNSLGHRTLQDYLEEAGWLFEFQAVVCD